MDNDQACSVTGIGSVKFLLRDDSFRVVEGVSLVSKLMSNLLSWECLILVGVPLYPKKAI